MSIKDTEVRKKINELMRITDKIMQDAIADPSDIPQIKKFMNYYLPTTIKLLNAYDRMSAQGIEGENLDQEHEEHKRNARRRHRSVQEAARFSV